MVTQATETIQTATSGLGLQQLPILLGRAKELGIVYINIIRGAKEPRNLQQGRQGILK